MFPVWEFVIGVWQWRRGGIFLTLPDIVMEVGEAGFELFPVEIEEGSIVEDIVKGFVWVGEVGVNEGPEDDIFGWVGRGEEGGIVDGGPGDLGIFGSLEFGDNFEDSIYFGGVGFGGVGVGFGEGEFEVSGGIFEVVGEFTDGVIWVG